MLIASAANCTAIQQFVYNRESTILQSGDSAAFYRYVNESRVHKDGVAPLLNEQGEPAVSDREKTHILITQFTSVFTIDNGNLPDIEPHTPIEISDINFTPELVRKFMCKLPNKFSRSPDGIPSAVLKMLSYELCQPLYSGHDIKLLKPLARGASRFGKLLARLTDKIITYWTTACDIPTISNLNTS